MDIILGGTTTKYFWIVPHNVKQVTHNSPIKTLVSTIDIGTAWVSKKYEGNKKHYLKTLKAQLINYLVLVPMFPISLR